METRKPLFGFVLMGAFAVSLMCHAGQALAAFTCGPHMKTYSVTALDGRPGQGVRCVFFPGGKFDREFVWYGEGFWGRMMSLSHYRHVGENWGRDTASAADIYGNGEHTNAAFYGTLQMTFSNRNQTTPPSRIEVRGTWNEAWTLETDNVHQEYTHPSELRRIQVCGKNFWQFEAIDRPTSTASKNGFGVRCFAKRQQAVDPGFALGTWYGEGQWNGGYYAHLGSHTSTLDSKLTAADICERSLFGYCGKAGSGQIRHTYYGARSSPLTPARYIKVEGGWREDWVLNDVNPCCASSPSLRSPVLPPVVR